MAERTSDTEKVGFQGSHQVEDAVLALASDERVNAFTLEEQRSIIGRINLRLLLTLGFLYMIILVDRTHLGQLLVRSQHVLNFVMFFQGREWT